jgi:uncharacterized protein YraI
MYPMPRFLRVAALAIAVTAIGAGAAFAYPATATRSAYIHDGPGFGYHIIDRLHSSEQVNVDQCWGGWCYVEHRGPDGWVPATFLDSRYAPPPVYYPPAPPRPYFPPPPFHHGPDFPPPTDHWHDHGDFPPPDRWQHRDDYRPAPGVCFGDPSASFCVNP